MTLTLLYRRRVLQKTNESLLQWGEMLLSEMSGGSVEDYQSRRERCQKPYDANKVMIEQIAERKLHATSEEDSRILNTFERNLGNWNEDLDRMDKLKDEFGDRWTKEAEDVSVRL
jgi:hypothetical protein